MAVTARKREEPRAQGGIGQFLRDVYEELRKVVWPTGGELYRYTLVVIVTVPCDSPIASAALIARFMMS